MQIDVDNVDESKNGWNIRLKVNLSSEELSRLNHEAINDVEDFKINLKGSNLYFNTFLNTAEPWEDEPLEELLKAIKLEVEYHVQALLE
jgi:hypothetical protein